MLIKIIFDAKEKIIADTPLSLFPIFKKPLTKGSILFRYILPKHLQK